MGPEGLQLLGQVLLEMKGSRKMRRIILNTCLASIAVVVLTGGSARGEFVNGVERFGGTTLDLATWEVFNTPGYSTVIQNDGLIIHGEADITSRAIMLGVGDKVRARMRIVDDRGDMSKGWVAMAGLSLTNNSYGSSAHKYRDSTFIDVRLDATQERFSMSGRVDGNYGLGGLNFTRPEGKLNTTYILEIHRIAPTQAEFSVYDEWGDLLTSSRNSLTAVTEELYVSVWSNYAANAEFDSITIPEPATLGILVVAAVAALRRRRRNVEPME